MWGFFVIDKVVSSEWILYGMNLLPSQNRPDKNNMWQKFIIFPIVYTNKCVIFVM